MDSETGRSTREIGVPRRETQTLDRTTDNFSDGLATGVYLPVYRCWTLSRLAVRPLCTKLSELTCVTKNALFIYLALVGNIGSVQGQ